MRCDCLVPADASDHACSSASNIVVHPVRPLGSTVPLAAMFASRDITPGEELRFDYADAGQRGQDDLPNDSTQVGRTPCLCGSDRSVRSF